MKFAIRALAAKTRQILAIALAVVAFLIIPAVNAAYAADLDNKLPTRIDKGTLQRIQEKAEDFGDSDERPIGDTGLKNIRKLGENIPETLELNARQKGAQYTNDRPNTVRELDKAQRKAERD